MIHQLIIDVKAVLKYFDSEFVLDLLKQVNVFSKQVEQSVIIDSLYEQLVCDRKDLAPLKNCIVEIDHLIDVLLRVVPEEA